MARKSAQDLVWREFFRDPLPWSTNKRNSKVGPAYPLFRHKVTKESLWIDVLYNPPWVAEELDEGSAFVALLRACARNKDLYRGTQVHDDILRRGFLEKCSDALVTMYAKCGSLVKAKELFDLCKSRDVCTWTSLIAGFAQNGQGQDALKYFEQMQCEGLLPDAVTFTCILKACGSMGAADKGEQIHDEIAKQGLLGSNIVLGNALVGMYAKCGALAKARRVLEELPVRNVSSWNALIAGYAQQGEGEQALKCYKQMQREGLSPDAVTFSCILKACGSMGAAEKGEQIHDEIAKQGLLGNNIVLGNALVGMYAKCGALAKARQVLEELPFQNVVAWNALITGYAQQGEGEKAFNCFEGMQREGLSPNAVTFICILKACGSIGAADKGEKIHDEISKQGLLGKDIVLGTALVDMYAKCGALAKARQVLEELPVRNVISWNVLITGYAQQGKGEQALNCFEGLQREGLSPNAVTFICILKACGSTAEKIQDEIARQGLLRNDIILATALADVCAKYGTLAKTQQVLEEIPIWSTVVAGHAQHSEGEQALNSFGLSSNAVALICILKACSSIGAAGKRGKIHEENAKQRLLRNDIVLGIDLVDMYAKRSTLTKARDVLEELPVRMVSCWNALITGYAQ